LHKKCGVVEGMKRVLICVLLLLLWICVDCVCADTISAQIDSFDFPSGDWYRGSNQGGANVWIKNTGDVGHLFWVSYEVMDRRGQWYSAPPEPIYAEPGDSTYFVNPVWHIPDDAELGSYQADFYLYSYYDSNTGEFSEQLDQVDLAGAFSVVG
jgi:hypothetical protein